MNYHNSFLTQRKLNKRRKKKLFSFLLISTILFNFVMINTLIFNASNLKNNLVNEDEYFGNSNPSIPKSQGADLSLIKDPFTTNFTEIWTFFEENYFINFWEAVSTYYREGDIDGDITSEMVYSLDNLLLFNTLLKNEYTSIEILNKYINLKSSPLWYEGSGAYDYGFIEAVDSDTREKSYQRNLVDNLMSIFLLIEHMPSGGSSTYEENINDMFDLVNSDSQFWNSSLAIYRNSNSSDNYFYTESNLYSILANLRIIESNKVPNLNSLATIKSIAAMETLINNLWDKDDYGFYNSTDYRDLSPLDKNKDLKVNALGIITLLEYWDIILDRSEVESDYLLNATRIYDAYDNINLFDNIYETYYSASEEWNKAGFVMDLEANAYMMQACLKLFEATGEIEYYNRAFTLFNSFENNFYDSNNPGYYKSIDKFLPVNTEKNLLSNLRLAEAYISAVDTYQQTHLNSVFNESIVSPAFIFNQDTLIIRSNYTFESKYEVPYFIPNADITYILRYSNGTIFHIEHNVTNAEGNHTFYYKIPQTIPIGEGYSLQIYANTTNFGTAFTEKEFSIKSGIEYYSGLEDYEIGQLPIFQGETINVTIEINNTRNEDINLNFSVESDYIRSEIMNYTLYVIEDNSTSIWINFTVNNDALLGNSDFHFILKNGSIIFLDYIVEIKIGNALQYSNLLYDSFVVKGDILQVSITLTNNLPNVTQSFNLSFSGEYIRNIKEPITLDKKETKTFFYNINVTQNIEVPSIQVEMNISKSDISFHHKILHIDVINKFEITNIKFPTSVSQGSSATLIITIINNKRTTETFTLEINGERVSTGQKELIPGENKIQTNVVPTINPYDFGVKKYYIVIKDASGNEIYKDFYEVQIELSIMNLVLFYFLPILIPIGIIIFFKNKEMKKKLLRR